MTTTTTTTSGAAIQRYKIGYHADEWGQRSSTPSGIPDASGSWVRYADHVTALATGQATAAPAQPAAQQGVAYAEMPEKYYLAGGVVPTWDANQMRAFADATHMLRASHGQAPADAKALAEADRRAGEAERILATCKENVMRFEQVRSRMKYQWGADQRVSFDEVWDEALALKKAAQAAPTTQPSPAAQGDALDAARYRFLRDGEWRDTDLEPFIRLQLNTLWDAKIDAARAAQEGGN